MLCLQTWHIVGQKGFDKSAVSALFPNTSRNLWIHALEGTLDGVFHIQMILGTDGKQCKGYYKSTTDQELYYFEGTDENHKVFLTEYKDDGRPLAFIAGTYDGQRLFGQWMDKSKSNKLKIDLHYVPSFNPIKKNCENGENAYYLEGKFSGGQYKMQLFIQEATAKYFIHGAAFHHVDIVPVVKQGDGLVFDAIINDKTVSIALDSLSDQSITITSTTENAVWKTDNQLTFDCIEKLEYAVGYRYSTPLKRDKFFDPWMANKLKQLSRSSENFVKTKDKRWQYNVEVWTEVLFIDKNFIGGWIYAHDSRNAAPAKEAFLFDLDQREDIKVDALFKDVASWRDIMNALGKKQEPIEKTDKMSGFTKADYKYVTLSNMGIAVSTNFNTVYGEGIYYIPYKDVGDFLKDKYRYLAE